MIYVVFPVAMLIVVGAIAAFMWAARSGQFDDLDSPGMRMVDDDDSLNDAAAERRRD